MEAIHVYEKLLESMEQQNEQTRSIIDRFKAIEARLDELERENNEHVN